MMTDRWPFVWWPLNFERCAVVVLGSSKNDTQSVSGGREGGEEELEPEPATVIQCSLRSRSDTRTDRRSGVGPTIKPVLSASKC